MITLPSAKQPLSPAAAADAFASIMDGTIEDAEIARFLTELATRGETIDEVVAAARSLRERMIRVAAPADAIDVCGTGGDGRHSWNVSTAVAIVIAASGVPVAKHGNRAASSRSGAADVLASIGIDLNPSHDVLERQLHELGIAFLFAAHHHPAMARVAHVRRALQRRTIFNLLGPLANPAGVSRQLIGVWDAHWVTPIASALGELGTIAGVVVHGDDGLDEVTVTGGTSVASWSASGVHSYRIAPADAGLPLHDMAALAGGSPDDNAQALLSLIGGAPGAYRDIVVINAGLALQMAGKANTLDAGTRLAEATIDTGAAHDLLMRWKDFR